MKKETIITFRLPLETKSIIQSLADKDERTIGWLVRKLITEALETRGLSKPKQSNTK
ncbi:MAG: ribbon-helix-helix protein, CopG family [Candidatus Anammoxibacter sp.]